jgi:PAS domain S-box-containing protein
MQHLGYVALRTSLLYGIVGATWILFSDRLLGALFEDPVTIQTLQTYKGWAFIAVTATLLYVVLRSQLRHWEEEAAARRQAEVALQRYRLLAESARDIVLFVHPSGRILEANRAAAETYGYSLDELLRLPLQDLRASHAQAQLPEQLEAAAERGILFETVHRRRDGSTFPVEVSSRGAILEGERVLLSIIRDITERKRAEEALAEHTRHLEAVRAVSSEITQELDRGTVLRLVAERACEITGAAAADIDLWDEERQLLVPEASYGHVSPRPTTARRLGEGAMGAVAQTRQGMIVNDYQASPAAHPDTLAHTKITASLVEPLLFRNRLLGAIGVDHETPGRTFTERDQAALRLFADQAAIAIENARLYGEAERQRREAEILAALARRISASLDLDTILRQVAEGVKDLCGSDFAEIALRQAGTDNLVLRCAGGRPEAGSRRIEPGRGAGGMVLITGKPVRTDDYAADPRFIEDYLPEAQAKGVIAELAVPIQIEGRVEGVLFAANRSPRPFTARDEASLVRLADQAALALTNAKLFAATDRAAREAQSLYMVAHSLTTSLEVGQVLDLVVSQTREVLGTDHAQVVLWDEATQTLGLGAACGTEAGTVQRQVFRLGEGVNGIVAQTRGPLLVNDYQTFSQRVPELTALVAVLGVPLLYRDRLLGVLTTHTTRPGTRFTPEHLGLLTSLADQAAIAIENARLHAAAVLRGAEMEALLRATRSVMAGLDLKTVFQHIVDEAVRISRCVHVKLLLLDKDAGALRVGALSGTTLPVGFQFPLGASLSGIVVSTKQPLFSSDPSRDARNILQEADRTEGIATYLGLPILIHGEVAGVLTFNSTDLREYRPEELAYLTSFADTAALALENARLYTGAKAAYESLQRAQAEMVRTEQLRGLGQMAAGIAHDLNNTLATVLGQAELLKLRAIQPEIHEGLGLLETAATDGAAVVRRLQDFARPKGTSPLAPCALGALVQEVVEFTRPRWQDEPQRRGCVIRVEMALAADLPPILGHPPELREALTNLIFNAVDAMPQGGTLTLAARGSGGSGEGARGRQAAPGPEALGVVSPPLAPSPAQSFVELTVVDTGNGMSPEVQSKIFEPFFTTKGVKGTGLGLAVVYGILKRHGGTIAVASAPGQGTTFTLTFQRAPEARPAPEAPAAPQPAPSVLHLLVVDDEPLVRQTLVMLLRAIGHSVSEAPDGPTALARLRQTPVDLVLTDLGMPGMSGWELAGAIKQQHPTLPILLLTGWQEQRPEDAANRQHVDAILGKPVRMETLREALAELARARKPPAPG